MDIGAKANDAYVNCIGCKNGKGISGMASKNRDNSNGCDWASYGLFGVLGKGITVITPDGEKTDVFKFYEKEDEPCKT